MIQWDEQMLASILGDGLQMVFRWILASLNCLNGGETCLWLQWINVCVCVRVGVLIISLTWET